MPVDSSFSFLNLRKQHNNLKLKLLFKIETQTLSLSKITPLNFLRSTNSDRPLHGHTSQPQIHKLDKTAYETNIDFSIDFLSKVSHGDYSIINDSHSLVTTITTLLHLATLKQKFCYAGNTQTKLANKRETQQKRNTNNSTKEKHKHSH